MEETGAHIDEESQSSLSGVNNDSLWSITGVSDHNRDKTATTDTISTIEEEDLSESEKTDIPETTKKKKASLIRKSSSYLFFIL